MQVPTEIERLPHTAREAERVYDLRSKDGSSDTYYDEVMRFADAVLAGIEARAADVLDGYSHHVRKKLCEAPRSRGEYALDLLTLGMTLRLYARTSRETPRWRVVLAHELLLLCRHSAWLKPAVDRLRCLLFKGYRADSLKSSHGHAASANGTARDGAKPLSRLPNFIEWLDATGEFEQEAIRLENWRSYLATLEPSDAGRWMEVAGELFDSFKHEAASALAVYTQGVEKFLSTEYAHRGCREDQVLCGKTAAEYQLNMVAA